jgi:hypothetical protein
MDEKRQILRTFLSLHAHHAQPTSDPVAHLHFYRGSSDPLTCDLVRFTVDEIVAELDTESELVHWLLHQMTTYEPTQQRIVGVVFDSQTVLSEVLRTPRHACV